MRAQVVLLLISCLMYGCDVPGRIVIRNKSGDKAVYQYEFVKNGSPETIPFELGTERDKDEINMMFGLGHFWTDERITEYLSTINKIEIASRTDTLLLTDKKEMFDYFQKRRHGLFKHVITIKIH